MQQFDLSLWLKDKSRKIVTREGSPVRIVCWDRNTKYWKIIGLVTSPDGSTENPFTYDVNGNEADSCLHGNRNDIIFADEEELTEFERAIAVYIMPQLAKYTEEQIIQIKSVAKTIMELAMKESQEQKSAWSEEDEEKLNSIIEVLGEDSLLVNWLKSLKHQQNQYDKGYNDGYSASKYNHWKPSEEQMMTLCALCVLHKESKVLESLYNDLKSL